MLEPYPAPSSASWDEWPPQEGRSRFRSIPVARTRAKEPRWGASTNSGVVQIGVVTDTHFPRFGRALPRALERGLRRARVERNLRARKRGTVIEGQPDLA
jgi:hypothetical protein